MSEQTKRSKIAASSDGFYAAKDYLKAANRLISSAEWKNNQSFIRAAGRAAKMLKDSPFWAFDGKLFQVVSDTSGEHYRGITRDRCVCEGFLSRPSRVWCKHQAAFVILQEMSKDQITIKPTPEAADGRPLTLAEAKRQARENEGSTFSYREGTGISGTVRYEKQFNKYGTYVKTDFIVIEKAGNYRV